MTEPSLPGEAVGRLAAARDELARLRDEAAALVTPRRGRLSRWWRSKPWGGRLPFPDGVAWPRRWGLYLSYLARKRALAVGHALRRLGDRLARLWRWLLSWL
jgi:hypothetical protein